MTKSYEQWLTEIKKQKKGQLEEKIANNNIIIDKEISENKANYDEKILQTQNEFESLYDLNEIQRIINKKQLAEKMANIGVTDSGLNRTQNTAVQLSYSNARGTIGLQEQAAITSLKTQLAQHIAEAQARKAENEIKLRDEFEAEAEKQAKELYQAELDAENERLKLELEAKSKQSSASSSSTTKKEEVIDSLKENFADIYKNYKGNYNAKNLNTVFAELAEAEEKYRLSAFECIAILANGRIAYDDYVEWKNNKIASNEEYEENKEFIAGVNYAPRWLRNDYLTSRKKGY